MRWLVAALAALSLAAGSSPDTVAECREMFEGKSDDTWRGADGAVTADLGDGRVAWLFGDTLRVGRPAVRNSVLVQEGDRLTSTTGGQAIPNDPDGSWYWPTEAVWDGGYLRVFAGRLGPAAEGWSSRGVALASFRLDGRGYPVYVGMRNVTRSGEADAVQWGAAAVTFGGRVYVWGQRHRPAPWVFGRDVYLAHAPVGRLTDLRAWRYRTRWGWSSRPAAAEPIELAETGRFGSTFTVDLVGGTWLAVSKEADFIGDRVVAMSAQAPWGPWREVGSVPAPYADGAWTYQARAHPELPLADGRMLVTWNLMTTDPSRLAEDAFPKPVCGAVSWR